MESIINSWRNDYERIVFAIFLLIDRCDRSGRIIGERDPLLDTAARLDERGEEGGTCCNETRRAFAIALLDVTSAPPTHTFI